MRGGEEGGDEGRGTHLRFGVTKLVFSLSFCRDSTKEVRKQNAFPVYSSAMADLST